MFCVAQWPPRLVALLAENKMDDDFLLLSSYRNPLHHHRLAAEKRIPTNAVATGIVRLSFPHGKASAIEQANAPAALSMNQGGLSSIIIVHCSRFSR
jgi:hypothetical protein